MIRLVLAALALLAPALLAAEGVAPGPDGAGAASGDAAVRHELDLSRLPLPNGWMLVPLRASEPTNVTVEAEDRERSSSSASGFLGALLHGVGDQAVGALGAGYGWGSGPVHVSYDGRVVDCCMATGLPMLGSTGGGELSLEGQLAPGDHWILFVVTGADELEATATLEADRPLEIGRPVVGRQAQAVDLVRAARDDGRHVDALGSRYILSGGEASVATPTRGTTFAFLHADASNDASATLRLRLGDAPTQAHALRDSGLFAIALQPGLRVSLEDVREPSGHFTETYDDRLAALVILAQIPLDLRAAHVATFED